MKAFFPRRALASGMLAASLAVSFLVPAAAFPWSTPQESTTQSGNQTPIARNMEFTTYKNVSLTGYLDALDQEGDVLTFQLTSTPARGSVTLAEDGSSQFVYTPYENKTGKDSFTYTATDSAGNTSAEGKVTIHIQKANTRVDYADMKGNPAHKASIRLAEEGIYVGACHSGTYFFQPDRPISRAEFLSLAMSTTGLDRLDDVTLTGFWDDEAIPTWCKGYVSSALMAGVIQGSRTDSGQCVFQPDAPVTLAEATVMLNKLLNITDVSVETFSPGHQGHWAAQATANLTATGILRQNGVDTQTISQQLTLGDTAVMLDGALDVLDNRADNHWFSF